MAALDQGVDMLHLLLCQVGEPLAVKAHRVLAGEPVSLLLVLLAQHRVPEQQVNPEGGKNAARDWYQWEEHVRLPSLEKEPQKNNQRTKPIPKEQPDRLAVGHRRRQAVTRHRARRIPRSPLRACG